MKKIIFTCLCVGLFASCKKDPAIYESAELKQQSGWTSEKFKSAYTIQFPENYSGGFLPGDEGGFFEKKRDSSGVIMTYYFAEGGLLTVDFGDTLADENLSAISRIQGDSVVLLDTRFNFTSNGEVAGILYFNNIGETYEGELYWKDGGVFKDALTIYYNAAFRDEVINILATIQHN